jgi:succinate dehydrogenase/fumarate reductase flavoprotein subunit
MWIPTIVNGTRYETLTEAMRKNGFNQNNDGERFGSDHRKIKKLLRRKDGDGTATYKNNEGNDVTFTLGN